MLMNMLRLPNAELKAQTTCFLICILILLPIKAIGQKLADLVDTRVGSAVAITKTAGMFGQGTEEFAHTLPAVLAPFGMNFWTAETQATEQKGVCPYLYKDEKIRGFRCSHWIVGGCTQDYGSFTISPMKNEDSMPFSHDNEIARPYYYSVTLAHSVKAEMTATERCGMLRFTFSNPDSAYIKVRVNSDFNEGELGIDTIQGYIFGKNPCHRIYQGWGEPTGTSSWFCVAYNKKIETYGRIDKQTLWVKFEPSKELIVKAACSFTRYEGAETNLVSEIPGWDFDSVKNALANVWEKKLGQIRIKSNHTVGKNKSSDSSIRVFYGSLYRTSFLPHKINDVDGQYPKFADGSIVSNNNLTDFHIQLTQYDYYDDFSMWDTFRAQHPLLSLLEPQRNGEMMQSLVLKYEQGGWMPIFPCWNSYTAAMIGDHCTAAIADAYSKGIRNFNILKAYEGMRKNAFELPATFEEYQNGMGRRALDSYIKYNYIPLEDSVKEAFHQNEQTSRTLEYAYDDYALAQVAQMIAENTFLTDHDLEKYGINRTSLMKDYKDLMKRSENWKNVLNPKTGWVGGRHADGSFAQEDDIIYIKEPDKHPEATRLTPTTFSTFITEGTPVHYSWYIPHDIEGLAKKMGGKKSMEAKLDSMFMRGWYWHGNEPCHQIAYLYSAIGLQNKTVDAIRNIMETEYMDAPGGLSGNDDAGQMSAWYIFSALGFYPVCPSKPEYVLGAPAFPEITIHLENGKELTIKAVGLEEGLKHVKSVSLNGTRITSTTINHFDLMKGGVLEFTLM